MPHAVAVRYLEKPIFGHHRTDLNRLEQNVEAPFAGHLSGYLDSLVKNCVMRARMSSASAET